jgi:hypothetical protein
MDHLIFITIRTTIPVNARAPNMYNPIMLPLPELLIPEFFSYTRKLGLIQVR